MTNTLEFSVQLFSIMAIVGVLVMSITVGVYCGLLLYNRDSSKKKRK